MERRAKWKQQQQQQQKKNEKKTQHTAMQKGLEKNEVQSDKHNSEKANGERVHTIVCYNNRIYAVQWAKPSVKASGSWSDQR